MRRLPSLVVAGCLAAALGMLFQGLATAQGKDAYRSGHPAPPRTPGPAGNDDCTSPLPIITVDYIDSGDTSGATNSVDAIPITCNGYYTLVQGPDRAYTFTVTAGNTLSFRLTTPSDSYDPSIYVLAACGDGASCPAAAGADRCRARELPQPAGCPVLDSTETFSLSFAPGEYFLYVDSFYPAGQAQGRDAGPYVLEVTGSLAVELLEFSIE